MKKIIKINESKIRQIIRESLDDEMALWKQRDESQFGKIIRKLDEIMKEMFVDADEYGFKVSPISHYVTAYALDGDEKYTAKRITSTIENYDMSHEPKVKRLLNKMNNIANANNGNNISETKIRGIVKESTNRYTRYFQPSHFILGDKTMEKLEHLVYIFALENIDEDFHGNVEWDNFVDGIIKLYEMSNEKAVFDKNKIGVQYKQAVANGKGDEYYDSIEQANYSDYLDDYLNNIEEWDKLMPNPNELKGMIEYFKQWISERINNEISNYEYQKSIELDEINKKLSNI